MESLKRYILPFIVLSCLVGIAVEFRSFFVANIIEPIAVLCWTVWGIISSVNQNIYWMILIVICSTLMIRLIPSGKAKLSNPAYNYRYMSPNRVEYWKKLIEESIFGKEEGERFRVNLENLLMSVTVKPGRVASTDSGDVTAKGQRQLSLRATRFLSPPKKGNGAFSLNHHLDIMSLIPKRLRRWAGKFVPQDTTAIAEILDYMEVEMEMSHDR